MNMVEKVARALAMNAWDRAAKLDPAVLGKIYPGGKDAHVSDSWPLYLDDARTAIETMMEPTEGMKKAAAFTELELSYGDENSFYYISEEVAGDVFWKMIDAALKEQSP